MSASGRSEQEHGRSRAGHQDEDGRAEVGGLEEPLGRSHSAEHGGKGEHGQRQHRRERDHGRRRQPGGRGRPRYARLNEHPVLERAGGRHAARHDASERVAGELRGADGEPARRPEHDPLQLPHRQEARSLEPERDGDPEHVQRPQIAPGGEDLDQARKQQVEGDGRQQQEEPTDDELAPQRASPVPDGLPGVSGQLGVLIHERQRTQSLAPGPTALPVSERSGSPATRR